MSKRIFVAGHTGMVGSSLLRLLSLDAAAELITIPSTELDLRDQDAVQRFFQREKPNQVYLAAARVGGIHANNTYPADFIYDNLMIQSNVVHASYLSGVERLLFLGSSCIYPRDVQQPMSEGSLLTGRLEPTNEAYAIAKIAGIKLCESYNRQHGTDYRSVMPTNLYGEDDNFHPENSHVIPALLGRFHEAKLEMKPCVSVWGSGKPLREFLYVDDMASASIHVMEIDKARYDLHTQPQLSHVNVGTGVEYTIAEVAQLIASVVGYHGRIRYDTSKPDGAPRKLMNSDLLRDLGWAPSYTFEEGLRAAYRSLLEPA
jgi:GDP-L-fucose synthase